MKKKLLTILLSVFMVVTAFSANVFAEDKTITNILATVPDGFPTDDANAWFCEYGLPAYTDDDKLSLYGPTGGSIDVPLSTPSTKDGNNYKYVYDDTEDDGDYELLFEMNSSEQLTKIKLSMTVESTSLVFTYEPLSDRKNIFEIMQTYGEDFPTSESTSWQNSNDSSVKMFLNTEADMPMIAIVNEEAPGFGLPLFLLAKPSNSNYVIDFMGINIEFIINDDKLDSIEINDYPGLSSLIGTYSAPLTIADILDTVEGGYPVSVDDETVPEGCFTTYDGYRLYYSSDKSELLVSDTPGLSIDPASSVTLDADGNYITTVTRNIPPIGDINIDVKLVMNNNELQKIEANGPFGMSYVFEPLGDRKSLEMLFNTTSDYPDPEDACWVNDKGTKLYSDSGMVTLRINGFPETFSLMPIAVLLSPSGSTYVVEFDDDGITVIANMKSGVLDSIELELEIPQGLPSEYQEEYEDMIQKGKGKYTPYKIVNKEKEITVGSTGEVAFKTFANYQDNPDNVTVKVQLEGEASPTELTYGTHYTLETGSTIVKLKGDYVKSLPKGTHTITIEVDGYASVSQSFKIKSPSSSNKSKKYSAPNTGVTSNNPLLKLSTLSLLALGTYIAIKKKKDN